MKNLLLSLAMLCVTSAVFGQLYISPNATSSTDSYIYVDDQILYVEEEINLVRNNNDATTEASIYLRERAQLIQGESGSTTNVGTGWLSVYQDSNSDAYDYNFWCSPVSGNAGTGNRNFGLTKLAEVETLTQSTTAATTNAHNGWSNPLTVSTRWYDYWNTATQRWVWGGTGNSIPAGYGFTMKGTNETTSADGTTVYQDANNQIYDFRGRPNNGDITLPVQTAAVPWTDGNIYYFTLAGNPYPSALDLKDVFYDTDNIEISEFRYWDEDRSVNSHTYFDNKGGYGTWVPGPEADDANPGIYTVPTFMNYDGAGNPISTAVGYTPLAVERRYAPIGQGFMIVGDPANPGDGQITIKNSHRQYVKEGASNNSEWRIMEDGDKNGTTNGFGPTTAADTGDGNDTDDNDSGDNDNDGSSSDDVPTIDYSNYTPQIRVHTIFGDGTHFRDMVLAFHDTATDGFDRGMDARHPMDGAIAEAYMPTNLGPGSGSGQGQNPSATQRNLVIQTIPFDDPRKMVPIAFNLQQEMNVEVKLIEEINVPYHTAYIHDSEANTYEEISNGEVWNRVLSPGEYRDRFFISFRTIDQEEQSPYEGGVLNDLIVKAQDELKENVDFVQNNPIAELQVSNPEGYDVKELTIFDMSGKLVLAKQNLGKQRTLRFSTGNFADGIYLVQLTTTDNLKIDYKINVINQ
ncbi:MAG: T9SS sorting signal type C domain-containing protein [Aureisphaera sp.]